MLNELYTDRQRLQNLKSMQHASRVFGRNVTTEEGVRALVEAIYLRNQSVKPEAIQEAVEKIGPDEISQLAADFIKIDEIQQGIIEPPEEQLKLLESNLTQIVDERILGIEMAPDFFVEKWTSLQDRPNWDFRPGVDLQEEFSRDASQLARMDSSQRDAFGQAVGNVLFQSQEMAQELGQTFAALKNGKEAPDSAKRIVAQMGQFTDIARQVAKGQGFDATKVKSKDWSLGSLRQITKLSGSAIPASSMVDGLKAVMKSEFSHVAQQSQSHSQAVKFTQT